MSIPAETLRQLAEIDMPAEALREVIKVLGNMPVTVTAPVTADDRSRKAKNQAAYRLRQKMEAVTKVATGGNAVTGTLPLEVPPIGSPKDNIKPLPLTPSRSSLRSVSVRAREAEKLFDEQFWPIYPRREGGNPKDPARKKFANLVVAGSDPAAIIEGLAKYAKAVIHENPRFIAQAVTWLNQRRWEDDHRTVPPKPPPKSYSRGNGLSEALDILRQRDAENGQRSQENEPDPRGSEGSDQGAGRGEDDLPFEARREPYGRTLDLVAASSEWH